MNTSTKTPPIVFFDLETSGLSSYKHEIIQIAAVACTLDSDEPIVDTFEQLWHFDKDKADPKALEMNSFDPARWNAEAVEPEYGLAEFMRFLEPYCAIERMSKNGKPYYVARLAGHNAVRFDAPFLQETAKRYGKFLPADFTPLDTLQLAAWLWPFPGSGDPENMKLPTLYRHLFGEDLEDAHDALTDVFATAKVAAELYRRIREGDKADAFAI